MSEHFRADFVENELEESIVIALKKSLPEKRLFHTIRVVETVERLRLLYGGNRSSLRLAALVHDYAKPLKFEEMLIAIKRAGMLIPDEAELYPEILHADASAALAITEFEIKDELAIRAIRAHTVGNEAMSVEDKILYLADYVEDGRDFEGVVELRNLTYENLDMAMLLGFDMSITELVERKKLIHPMTITCRNKLLLCRKV